MSAKIKKPRYRVLISYNGGPYDEVAGATDLDYFEAMSRLRELRAKHRGWHVDVVMEREGNER